MKLGADEMLARGNQSSQWRLGKLTALVVKVHFRFKEWSILEDLLDSKPLGALDQKKRLGVSAALDSDHLAYSTVGKEVILARLAGINRIVILPPKLISIITFKKLLAITTQVR
jgi:hypothetical protein